MTQNTNFAFPLAIDGTHEQLKALAEKLIALGYRWESGIKLFEADDKYLVTNFFNVNGILATGQVAGEKHRRLVSLSTHSEACILALAAARADGEYRDGEWAWDIEECELVKCTGLIGCNPERVDNYRRPTFEEIVAHFAAKEQPVAEPSPQPAPEPTLLDRLKSGEVKKVINGVLGVSLKLCVTEDKEFPIEAFFSTGWRHFTKDGLNKIYPELPECSIRPYVEPKPFLMESNPTGEDAQTYYEAGEMVQATLQAEIDRLKKEMADMLETQQQAAREWNERECALVGTINELQHEQKSTDRTIQRLEEQAGQFDSEYLRLQRAFNEAMSIIDGFQKLTDILK